MVLILGGIKMKKIIFVTGNKHKLEIAQSVLGLYDINVENVIL